MNILGTMFVAAGGMAVGSVMTAATLPYPGAHTNLVALSERGRVPAAGRVQLPPLGVELNFVSDDDWRADPIGKTGAAGAYTRWPRAAGEPCKIYAPASRFTIVFQAAAGRARWADPSDGVILAHEILHCVLGAWHPGWDQIDAAYGPYSAYRPPESDEP